MKKHFDNLHYIQRIAVFAVALGLLLFGLSYTLEVNAYSFMYRDLGMAVIGAALISLAAFGLGHDIFTLGLKSDTQYRLLYVALFFYMLCMQVQHLEGPYWIVLVSKSLCLAVVIVATAPARPEPLLVAEALPPATPPTTPVTPSTTPSTTPPPRHTWH